MPPSTAYEDRAALSSAEPGPTAVRPTEITALLGRGTHFEGKLFCEGRTRIDGSFRGEIEGEDVLVIGEGATIHGSILVATCIVTGGEVEADIRAYDAIELYAPARVTGALHAPAIFIDRGVVFRGTCTMAPLELEEEVESVKAVDATEPSTELSKGAAAPRAEAAARAKGT